MWVHNDGCWLRRAYDWSEQTPFEGLQYVLIEQVAALEWWL